MSEGTSNACDGCPVVNPVVLVEVGPLTKAGKPIKLCGACYLAWTRRYASDSRVASVRRRTA